MFIEKICSYATEVREHERPRLFNFIPVGIGVGVCLYFSLDREPIFEINLCCLLLLLIAFICCKSHKLPIAALLTIGVGFFCSQLRTKTVDTFMLNEEVKIPVHILAEVEVCEKTEKGLMFIVTNVKQSSDRYKIQAIDKFNKLHLTWRGEKAKRCKKDYRPGDKLQFSVILSPILPQAFIGAYDFRKQQYFKQVSARGFITRHPKIIKRCKQGNFAVFIERLRHKINKKMEEILPVDIAAVAEALTTGNKSGVSQSIRDSFARSGTAHILAISGLHMGIIGLFVFCLFRLLLCCAIGKFYNVKKISAVISWIAVLFYLFISGCSVPSVRAFIMHTLIIIAILLNRTALTMRSVAIAATIIILYSPEVILFPSFQMSFGAVIAIVAFYEYPWKFSPAIKMVLNVVATTIVASIPTTLFSICAFNQLTLNSILANVVAVPLMSFYIMPIAVLALFFMIFGWGQFFIILLGYGIDILIKIAYYTSLLPGSFFVMHTPSSFVMGILIFSGLILALVHHKIRLVGAGGVILGCVLYAIEPTPDVFVSKNSKAIGIKTNEGVCFNHLGYFRSITSAWAKSLGVEQRDKFTSKACRKYISQIDQNTFIAKVKDMQVLISDGNKDSEVDKADLQLRINAPTEFAESIYLPSRKRSSTKEIKRPWS